MSRRTREADRLKWVILLCLLPLVAQCVLASPHPALLKTSAVVRHITDLSSPHSGANRGQQGSSPAQSAGPAASLCCARSAITITPVGWITGHRSAVSTGGYVGNPTSRAPPLLLL